MSVQKTFANIVGLLIPFPKARRAIKDKLTKYDLSSMLEFVCFRSKKPRENSICLLEFNPFHGEVISAILPYFRKLGYNIDIVISQEVFKEHPFCRQDMHGIKVYKTKYFLANRIISCKRMKSYKHIFLMSSADYNIFDSAGNCGTFINSFYQAGLDPYITEHELTNIVRFNEINELNNNHIITLGKFDKGVFVNPHSFGNVKISPKNKTTTFITVGGIDPKRKNFDLLIKSVERLLERTTDFHIIVVGQGKVQDIPEKIRQYITITGRLKFDKMFKQMEKADFFLPLLDPENPAHERYITTGVTGSAQLIYGFGKVPVIQEKFADFYRFDNTNAVVYQDDMSKAMEDAISMSASDYQKLQDNLLKTASEIRQESFENLKRVLENDK